MGWFSARKPAGGTAPGSGVEGIVGEQEKAFNARHHGIKLRAQEAIRGKGRTMVPFASS